jgi:hypothetical protein
MTTAGRRAGCAVTRNMRCSYLCSAVATCALSSSCTAVLSDCMASSNLPMRSSAMPLKAHSTQHVETKMMQANDTREMTVAVAAALHVQLLVR